ncbi:acetylornithine aminotransferase [Armatimonadota bacterium]|nr:acetylornithine aminotransferase [Armatimonadota bacterium]
MTTGTLNSASEITFEEAQALDRQYVMGTYARQPVVFVRGEGARLWDSEGKEYLDFLAGIAVVGVGHCHPKVADAIAKQAHTLMHVSNLYHNPHQARLAQKLCQLTEMEKIFFCNSGAEANECALKIARKWGKEVRGAECYEIITFLGSFHGRTMGTVAATAQPKYQQPFAPLVPGFHYAPLNDLDAVHQLVSEKTCAIMIEPIQGEGGINIADPAFLKALRTLCDENEILLIFDEVQAGMGRTGKFLGSQTAGVQGDIVTMAKGIADGFPMGACAARGTAATTLVPGDHGCTFGGQALACATALATLEVLIEEDLMGNAVRVGGFFLDALRDLQAEFPNKIKTARGAGLMVALEFSVPIAREIIKHLLESGIVANATSDVTLRFVPPLIVTEADCRQVVDALRSGLL